MASGWQVVRSLVIVGLNAYQAPERMQDISYNIPLPLLNMHMHPSHPT